MDEVENQGITQETAQEIAQPTTETEQVNDEARVQSEREEKNQRNWRELRLQKEEWERKARMNEELLQRVMSQQSQAPSAKIEEDEDFLHDLAKEDYVPGEKVAKGFKKIEEKFERKVQEIEKRYAQTHQNSLFQDLKREYPDFDEIVNPENLALLEEQNPRLAQTIANSKDPYAIAIQSYEYIKAKGLSNKPISRRAVDTEKRIEQNKKTVQSPQAFDKRPIATAFQMTEAMKKELFNEMNSYAQQAGMGY